MRRSLYEATNILRRLYGDMPASTTLYRAEIFRAAQKSDSNQKERDAVYSLLSAAFQHGLIRKEYDPRNHTLEKIILTPKGEEALRQGAPDKQPNSTNLTHRKAPASPGLPNVITLQFLSDVADEYMRQNPSWTVDVTPRRKTGGPMQQG